MTSKEAPVDLDVLFILLRRILDAAEPGTMAALERELEQASLPSAVSPSSSSAPNPQRSLLLSMPAHSTLHPLSPQARGMLSEEAARLLLLIRSRPADTSSQLPQSAALQQEFVNLTSRVNALNSKVLSQGVDVEANSEKLDETFLLAREANNLGGQNRSETSALQHNLGVRISALEAEGRARSVTGTGGSRADRSQNGGGKEVKGTFRRYSMMAILILVGLARQNVEHWLDLVPEDRLPKPARAAIATIASFTGDRCIALSPLDTRPRAREAVVSP
ncbi:hypothetical protein JCM11641_003899 [Rhodosporidiobolus odoratus]